MGQELVFVVYAEMLGSFADNFVSTSVNSNIVLLGSRIAGDLVAMVECGMGLGAQSCGPSNCLHVASQLPQLEPCALDLDCVGLC